VSNKETVTWNVTIEKLAEDRPPGKELEIGFSLTSCTPTKLSTFSEFSGLTEIGKIGFRKRNQDCVSLSSSGWLAAGGLPKDRVSGVFVQGDRVTVSLDFREGNGFYEFLKNGVTFGAMPYDVNTLPSKQSLKMCTCRLMVGLWAGDRVSLC